MKSKRFVSLLLSALMVLTMFAGLSLTSSAAEAAEAPNELILHCWCWNFNNIKANMKKIAESGYTALQTSPINAFYGSAVDNMQIYGNNYWYYQYQPTNYTIGNYQLGTEEEFKAMCEEAHKYGIKVIVDIVANHTTPTKSAVSSTLMNIPGGLYHSYSSSTHDRKRLTQMYDGLPDINTQNPNYQQLILNYLKTCVADGADGFRYDTAKHIELPDDDESFAGNFWPVVLDNGSTYQYGEVLQGANSADKQSARFKDYSMIMNITASSYGNKLRGYLQSSNAGAASLSSYDSEGASSDKLVVWVESHDTYANSGKANNVATSFWLTNAQIRRGWAAIAARKDITCLFFNRPAGSEATVSTVMSPSTRWGNNVMGAAGDENYFDPEVVAVNKFHNLMKNEDEKLVNINRDKNALMIERGSKGVVMINNGSDDIAVNEAVTMADGTYIDDAHGGIFEVKGGIITGSLKGESVAVVYRAPDTKVSVKAKNSTLYVSGKTTVTATVKDAVGATTYKSSNSKVASVDSKGNVKALKKGTAKITATNYGKTASVTIKVKNPSLNKTSVTLKKGKTSKLKITGLIGKAKFSSSNKKIATVNSKGKIKALKKGKATVTAKANGIKLKCKVVVK